MAGIWTLRVVTGDHKGHTLREYRNLTRKEAYTKAMEMGFSRITKLASEHVYAISR